MYRRALRAGFDTAFSALVRTLNATKPTATRAIILTDFTLLLIVKRPTLFARDFHRTKSYLREIPGTQRCRRFRLFEPADGLPSDVR